MGSEVKPDTGLFQEHRQALWFRVDDGGRVCLNGIPDARGFGDPDLKRYRQKEDASKMISQSSKSTTGSDMEGRQEAMLLGHSLSMAL